MAGGRTRTRRRVISGSASDHFLKTGPAVLELTAANTCASKPRVQEGMLRLNDAGGGGNDRLPTATNLIVSAGATFDTNGFSQTVGSLSGGGTARVTTGGVFGNLSQVGISSNLAGPVTLDLTTAGNNLT